MISEPSSSAAAHLAQQQQGLVVTPEALNWCARPTYPLPPSVSACLPACLPTCLSWLQRPV